MKIKVIFFQKDFLDAIGAGVYEIKVKKNGKEEVIYIGESVFVMVRCASHLYSLKNNPCYFGFTEKTIDDEDVELIFQLIDLSSYENIDIRKKADRRYVEKKEIDSRHLIGQSGINDYMRSVEEKVALLTNFLESV